ncbi:MAG: hypothetical protein IKI57_06800 [Clostridia bacterium]|nr:hypothetical protein [Clostridia bacterium]
MSLTQLFNFKFFVQNLKKSKALIILTSLLLPVFTFLGLSLFGQVSGIVDFWQVGLFNMLFMYIIPVVLSISLFNFVFKKKSCDFIMGMPLSRKTIFLTNTIGGILLIVLIQIITALLTALFSIFASGAIIFSSVIFDTFLFFTVSYIFVFVACNLAISFSGNIFATLVSLLLILFLVPFSLLYSRIGNFDIVSSSEVKVDIDNNEIDFYEPFNFTAPSMAFESLFLGTYFGYNGMSIVKMVGLCIVYFGLGLVLFNRKRFEMAEESYESTKIHLIIKLLTLAPFVAFFCSTGAYRSSIGWLFFIAVLATYYYVFDLITNKKISLKITIPLFLVSTLTMIALYHFIIPKLDILSKKSIKIEDVKCVEVDSIRTYGNYYNDLGLIIDDEELVGDLLRDCSEFHNYSPYIESSYTDFNCNLNIELENGTHYLVNKWIGRSLEKAIKKYGDNVYQYDEIESLPQLIGVDLNREDRNNIRNSLREDLNNMSYKNYYEMIKSGTEGYTLILANYKNHKLIASDYSYIGLINTSKLVADLLNKQAYTSVYGIYSLDIYKKDDLQSYMIKVNPDIKFADLEELKYENKIKEAKTTNDDIISGDNDFKGEFDLFKDISYDYAETSFGVIDRATEAISKEDLIEFVNKDKKAIFNREEPYLVLSGYGNKTFLYYTNNIEEFYKLMAKTYNEKIYPNESSFKLNENIQ